MYKKDCECEQQSKQVEIVRGKARVTPAQIGLRPRHYTTPSKTNSARRIRSANLRRPSLRPAFKSVQRSAGGLLSARSSFDSFEDEEDRSVAVTNTSAAALTCC